MRRVSLAVAALVCACGGGGATEGDAVGRSRAPVIGGVVDVPAKYDATVLLETDVGGGSVSVCTGTLITPHVVVTAHHCVASYSSATGFGPNHATSKIRVWYGAEPRATHDNTVIRIVHNGQPRLEDNDLALLVLRDAATPLPFAAVRLASVPVKGEAVAVAGYGITEVDPAGATLDQHKRYRREDLSVAYVGPIHTIYLGANELIVGESICRGDSGGPLYAVATSALVAVSSRGSNGAREDASKPAAHCVGSATINYFTRTDAFAGLIRKTVREVGEVLWEEGEPRPTQPPAKLSEPGTLGAYCTSNDECDSSLCVDSPGGQVCSVSCSGTNPCAVAYQCVEALCLRAPEPEPQPEAPKAPAPPSETSGCAMSPARADRSSLSAALLLSLAVIVACRRLR